MGKNPVDDFIRKETNPSLGKQIGKAAGPELITAGIMGAVAGGIWLYDKIKGKKNKKNKKK